MRIAMSALSGISYGGATYFNNLLPALAALDSSNEYHIFVPQGHPLTAMIHQANFLFHECIKNNQSALKRFLWEQIVLSTKLKRYRVDLMFTAKNINIFLAPCKTVISIRNMEPLKYKEYNNNWKLNAASCIKFQLTKLSIRKADKIVAVSQAVKDHLEKRFSGIGKRISVVYNGSPARSEVAMLGDDSAQPYILSASKFVAYANQLNLVEGYAQLLKRIPEIPPLWFAGGVHDQKYFKKVHDCVKKHGLENKVNFLGLVPHEKLISLYSQARAFIFPSTLEACPHTLIEAMACGVPIATSTSPPMPEIGKDAAIYFDPSNPEDIARKIEQVIFDEPLRANLQKAGPLRAADFTWEKTARNLIEVFENTL